MSTLWLHIRHRKLHPGLINFLSDSLLPRNCLVALHWRLVFLQEQRKTFLLQKSLSLLPRRTVAKVKTSLYPYAGLSNIGKALCEKSTTLIKSAVSLLCVLIILSSYRAMSYATALSLYVHGVYNRRDTSSVGWSLSETISFSNMI